MLHVGTSGWAIPAQFRDRMPATGTVLERYAQRLNATEINSSFYRHHRQQTFTRWAASVPGHFRFSVKMPKALTHGGELTPEPTILDRCLDESRGLGPKLEVLLLQFPPKLAFNVSSAHSFFSALRKRTNTSLACEPRHPSWGSPEGTALLREYAVARVAADPPRWQGADEPAGAHHLAYFRWHGQPRMYYSDYRPARLAALNQQIARALQRSCEVWMIFDNTVLGCALGNALTLAALPPAEFQH